jgi:hypothetical protein
MDRYSVAINLPDKDDRSLESDAGLTGKIR